MMIVLILVLLLVGRVPSSPLPDECVPAPPDWTVPRWCERDGEQTVAPTPPIPPTPTPPAPTPPAPNPPAPPDQGDRDKGHGNEDDGQRGSRGERDPDNPGKKPDTER